MQIVQPFIVAEWQLRHGLANEAALGGLLST
jgi:hypothetical protein